MTETSRETNRKEVGVLFINNAVSDAQKHLAVRLNEKGVGTFASKHEIYGVIIEEVHELLHAIQSNEPLEHIQHELRDITIAAIFADACIQADTVNNW
jgi:hypothetical protein